MQNKIICPLLEKEYALSCDYWHLNEKKYQYLKCVSGKCNPDSSVTPLEQNDVIKRMSDVLEKGGFIIAKLDKGKKDSDYWGKDYRAFVIYGMDMNAKQFYLDDPSDLHFADTFESFFERNVDLFFVTKK